MFSDKNKRRGATAHDPAVTILTSNCQFNGKLYCKGASRIGGKIEGQVISEGLLIIEEEAEVKANIIVDEVIVQGQISGTLQAHKRVELRETSRFQGEIVSPALIIREGAQFDGRAAMSNDTVDLEPANQETGNTAEPQLNPNNESANRRIPDVTIANN